MVRTLLAVAHCIPALRSSLATYEHGLEVITRGTPTAFALEELKSIAAKFTHHLLNPKLRLGTRALSSAS